MIKFNVLIDKKYELHLSTNIEHLIQKFYFSERVITNIDISNSRNFRVNIQDPKILKMYQELEEMKLSKRNLVNSILHSYYVAQLSLVKNREKKEILHKIKEN